MPGKAGNDIHADGLIINKISIIIIYNIIILILFMNNNYHINNLNHYIP